MLNNKSPKLKYKNNKQESNLNSQSRSSPLNKKCIYN